MRRAWSGLLSGKTQSKLSVDDEFSAYASLPEIVTADLQRWFYTDGPAYRKIVIPTARPQTDLFVLQDPRRMVCVRKPPTGA